MVVIKLNGRLGNQLFLFSAALLLCKSYGKKVILLNQSNAGTHPIICKLVQKIREPIEISNSLFLNAVFRLIDYLNRKPLLNRFLKTCRFVFIEDQNKPLILERLIQGRFVVGFFQRSWVVDQNRKQIVDLLEDALKELSKNRICLDSSLTMLHLRRGDYLANSSNWGVLSPEYYSGLLNSDETFYCFTDSRREDLPAKIVEMNSIIYTPKEMSDIETIWNMSNARKLVIANSSFSWWAGYLAASKGAKVLAPIPWFRELRSWNSEIYPSFFQIRDAIHED